MSLVNVGNDVWLTEYASCEKLSREIMEQIHQMNQQKNDALSGKIRIRLRQYAQEVKQLGDKLLLASVVSTLSEGEVERRKRQVENLSSRVNQLNEEFSRKNKEGFRGVVDLGTSSWNDDERIEIAPETQNVTDMKTQQRSLLKEQDEGLEALSKIISRQKEIASAIGNEVDEHNDILDDIGDNIDRVDARLHRETAMIRTISAKDSVWVYWIIIVGLLIAIICVSVM